MLEALRSGRGIEQVYLAEGVRPGGILDEIARLSGERGVRIQHLDRRALDRLSEGAVHQGVLAEVEEYRYVEMTDLLSTSVPTSPIDPASIPPSSLPLIVALDGLEDPQNFGTLIRTSDAIGATGVIIPLHRSVGVTPAVAKASAGAVEFVRIARVTNLARTLASLKELGFWIIGLDQNGAGSYSRFAVDVPIVLVVGAEGKGIGRLVKETCDALVQLPMRGHVSSLNAGVAGSIVLYEIVRRRNAVATDTPHSPAASTG